MRCIADPYRVRPDEYVDVDTSRQGLTESRSYTGCVWCVCLVCSPLCLQYQVGESCAYVNTSRTSRDTRNCMQVHLVRGEERQETAQGALGI